MLADPMNKFMEKLGRRALKKSSAREVFDSIIVEFKGELKNAQFKEKNSNKFKAKKERNQIGGRSETVTN